MMETKISRKDGGIHKIKTTTPIFIIKKENSQREHIKTDYSHNDKNLSAKSASNNSVRRSS